MLLDIKNYIKLFEMINKKYKSRFFLAGGENDEELIKEVMNSNIGSKCFSFSKMQQHVINICEKRIMIFVIGTTFL